MTQCRVSAAHVHVCACVRVCVYEGGERLDSYNRECAESFARPLSYTGRLVAARVIPQQVRVRVCASACIRCFVPFPLMPDILGVRTAFRFATWAGDNDQCFTVWSRCGNRMKQTANAEVRKSART